MNRPQRGELWLVQLDPVRGREQAKTRPCLIVSNDRFNSCTIDLCIIIPMTSKCKRVPQHIVILPEESGLEIESFIMPEHIRSISIERLLKRVGSTSRSTMLKVEKIVKALLNFD